MELITLEEPGLVSQIAKLAQSRGTSPHEFVVDAVRYYIALERQKRIAAESAAWYNLPAEERNRYRGMYVAVLHEQIIDQDKEEQKLFDRVRANYGNEPVLITAGGDEPMPTYRVPSLYLET